MYNEACYNCHGENAQIFEGFCWVVHFGQLRGDEESNTHWRIPEEHKTWTSALTASVLDYLMIVRFKRQGMI